MIVRAFNSIVVVVRNVLEVCNRVLAPLRPSDTAVLERSHKTIRLRHTRMPLSSSCSKALIIGGLMRNSLLDMHF